MAMPLATPTDLPRDFMDTMAAMAVMDTVAITARGMLRLSPDMDMDMLEATPTGLPRDFVDTMAAMVAMDMAATMARGLLRLSLDMVLLPTIPMAVPALSTGAPMDHMDTTSTTPMARGPLSLAMAMDMGITE